MDLGDLRYRIAADTSDLDRAGDRMDGFTRSAQGAERQTDELGREVKNAGRTSQKATGQMQKGMRSVETATERASKQMVGLRSALGGIAGYLGAREIIQYSDAWNNAANQLRQVTDSASELAGVQRTLMGVANDTRSQFQSTANLYSRLARSTTELGLSQSDLVGLTRTINQSFAVSGATAEEASAAITQLSQGLAAGALRGDEFNSVAEQAPGILRAVADSLGMGIGELREFAATGGITAEIIVNALQGASDTIDNQFSKSVATFGQQMTVANNNLTAFIGSSGSLQGILSGVGSLIMGVSMALSDYSTQIDITVGAISGIAVAYGALRGATVLLTAAQAALNAVARANPYVLAFSAIAAGLGVLYSLRDATVEIGNTTARVGDYMVAAWQLTTEAIGGAWDMIAAPLSNAIMSIADVFGETSDNSAGFWSNAMDTVIGAGRATVNGLIGLFRGLSYALAQIIYNISDSFANLFTGISDAASAALSGDWEGVKEAMNRELINPLNGVMDAFVGQQKDYLGEWGAAWTTRVAQNTAEFKTLDEWLLKADSSIKKVGASSGQTANQLKAAAKAASQFDQALIQLTDSLNPLQASQRQYMQDQMLLQTAWVTGRITALEYFDALQKLNQAQMSSQTASQAYSGGFGSEIGSRGEVGSPTDPNSVKSEWDEWLESARNAFSDFDNLNKQAAESFTQGFGNAIESMVFDFENLGSAAQGVFENIARSVVNALGQMAAQWVAYQAIQIATGQSAQAAATAGAAATGAGMAAAYAPAAALASLASFGANAAPAQAGLTATTALASSLAASSGFAGLFDKGGSIRAGQFGIVGERGPEIVNGPANITGRRDTARMMSSGTSWRSANDEGGGYKNVTINNYGSNEVVQSDDGNGGLTIDIVKAELARDFRTNGQVSQAGQQNFQWQRKGR